MKKAALLLTLAAILTACGNPAPPTPAASPTPAPAASKTPAPVEMPANAAKDVPTSRFVVSIVDLQGAPIAEVAAIVTEAANAFDEPLVRGSISGADGKSELIVPRDRATFVRGWDPKQGYFANSFLTVDAGDAPLPAESKVVMAPSARFTAQIYGLDGAPLPVDSRVEVMFSHPEEGPWWPTRATADPSGRILLEHVPAGKFNVTLEAESGGTATVPEALLLPRQPLDAGIVRMQ